MTEEEIRIICKKYSIRNYTINSDTTIDVDGDVLLFKRDLTKIPLKFNKVGGNFYCSYNSLITLEGCPNCVIGNFFCFDNNLTTRQQISLLNVCGTIHSTNLWKF